MDDEFPSNVRTLFLGGVFVLAPLLISWYGKETPGQSDL